MIYLVFLSLPLRMGRVFIQEVGSHALFLRCVSYRCSVFASARASLRPIRKVPTFFFYKSKIKKINNKQLIGAKEEWLSPYIYICIEINRSLHTSVGRCVYV